MKNFWIHCAFAACSVFPFAACETLPEVVDQPPPADEDDRYIGQIWENEFTPYRISDQGFFRACAALTAGSEDEAYTKVKKRVLETLRQEINNGYGTIRLGGITQRITAPPLLPQDKIVWKEPVCYKRPNGQWLALCACEIARADVEAASKDAKRPSGYNLFKCDFNSGNVPAEISGIGETYRNEQDFSPLVVPAQDAYLSVFWINADGRADVVRQNVSVKSGKGFRDSCSWEAYICDPAAKEEWNRLIFVLTKSSCPFSRPSGYDGSFPAEFIDTWLAQVPPSEFSGYVFTFSITR